MGRYIQLQYLTSFQDVKAHFVLELYPLTTQENEITCNYLYSLVFLLLLVGKYSVYPTTIAKFNVMRDKGVDSL